MTVDALARADLVERVADADINGVLADLDKTLPGLTEKFAATAARHDRDASFPFENFVELHRHGLLALTAPRDYGGGGGDLAVAAKVVAAVARGEPSTALVLTMQYLQHLSLSYNSGWPDHLKARIVRDAVESGALINALRVEPDLGTPARGGLPATVAVRTADGWRLSGRKIYSTGAPILSWYAVWARTDEDAPRVGQFLVHSSSPGIRIEDSWDHVGLRASGSHDVVFDHVPAPHDHALGLRAPAEAEALDPRLIVGFSVLTAVIYDSVARSGRDWLIDWLWARKPANLGAPLATLPRLQEVVGEIDGLLLSNRTLLDAAIRGDLSPVEAGLTKYLVTENAIAALEKALKISGNPGASRHNPLERHYRDSLCGRIHSPQADSVLTGAGKFAIHSRNLQ